MIVRDATLLSRKEKRKRGACLACVRKRGEHAMWDFLPREGIYLVPS